MQRNEHYQVDERNVGEKRGWNGCGHSQKTARVVPPSKNCVARLGKDTEIYVINKFSQDLPVGNAVGHDVGCSVVRPEAGVGDTTIRRVAFGLMVW